MNQTLRKEMQHFATSAGLRNLANSIITIFLPAYIYITTKQISDIFLFYFMLYSSMIVFTAIASKLISKYGPAKLIMLSAIPGIIFYLILYNNIMQTIGVAICGIIFGIFDAFYWLSYNFELAKISNDKDSTNDISSMMIIFNIVAIIGPLIGALLIKIVNIQLVFALSFLLLIIAPMPLFTSRNYKHDAEQFDIIKTIRKNIKNKEFVLTYLGQGALAVFGIFLSLMIYLTKPDFSNLGMSGSLIGIFAIIAIAVSRYTYSKVKYKQLPIAIIVLSITTALAGFINTSILFFMAWIIITISMQFATIPVDSTIIPLAKKSNKAEFFGRREIIFNIARITIVGLTYIFLKTMSIKNGFIATFIIFGILTALMLFFKIELENKNHENQKNNINKT
jgi:MFS family permease